MRGVRFFMFLVLIPAIAALGHDIYLFYTYEGIDSVIADAKQAIEDKGPFSFFASIGYIWTHYHPDSFRSFAQSIDEETWAYLKTLLGYKAFFVGLAFAALMYAILGVLKLLGLWPFQGEGALKKNRSASQMDKVLGRKKEKMKYKRK